ncbi:MAG: 4Fe-4S ferredoxin, partial [Bacillota bacterium]
MGKQLAFYVNQQVCMGCKTCQISCKDKNDLKVGQLWRRVYEVE